MLVEPEWTELLCQRRSVAASWDWRAHALLLMQPWEWHYLSRPPAATPGPSSLAEWQGTQPLSQGQEEQTWRELMCHSGTCLYSHFWVIKVIEIHFYWGGKRNHDWSCVWKCFLSLKSAFLFGVCRVQWPCGRIINSPFVSRKLHFRKLHFFEE